MSWELAALAGTRSTAAGSPSHKRNGASSTRSRMCIKELLGALTRPRSCSSVGVLELKLKQRLHDDPNAVAVGVLHRQQRHKNDVTDDHSKHHGSRHPKRAHKLPQLGAKDQQQPPLQEKRSPVRTWQPLSLPHHDSGARPDSFEADRQSVMDALALPSPTRSVIHKAVRQTKDSKQKQLAELPPVAGAFKKRSAPQSLFPRAYARNELPIMIESRAGGNTLRWMQPIASLDYAKLLPLFLEGLTETAHPYSFLAREGAFQLLQYGQTQPARVIECLHRVVPAVRQALDTHESKYIRDALTVLQLLTHTPGVGPLLVPYYRQLLPVLNQFKSKRRNLGDDMDFQQHRAKDIGEMIVETLEALERTGGADAFVNIKYMVPTYEGVRSS